MSSPFTPAAFNANVVPVQERGLRQSLVTEGRAEHDRKQEADAAAGRKRNETHGKNLAANAGLQPRPTQPTPATTRQMPVSSQTGRTHLQPTYHSLSPQTPQTPPLQMQQTPQIPSNLCRPNLTSLHLTDTPTPSAPPQPRRPLQPLSHNMGVSYPDYSQGSSSPAPSTQPSPPLPQLDWWNTLNPEAQARLLATLNRDAMAAQGDAGLLGSDDSYGDQGIIYPLPRRFADAVDISDPLNDIGTFPSLFAFSNDDATDHFDKDRDAQHEEDYEGDAESEHNYAEPTWADPIPADNDGSGSEPLPFTTQTVEASHQRKRKVREPAGKENDGDTAADEAPSKKKKKASRSIAALPEEHQKICEQAFTLIKTEITHGIPFPVAGRRTSKADPAANDDDFAKTIQRQSSDHSPTPPLTPVFRKPSPPARTWPWYVLIRSRIPQFRSGIKKTAQLLVPETYGLKHISSLANPTPELITTTIEKNRKHVQEIIKTYLYKVLNGYWFGEKEQDRAIYFKDKTHVELETLALIMVAVRCAIDKWTTGRWVLKVFSHNAYYTVYQKILGPGSWVIFLWLGAIILVAGSTGTSQG
ncbi:hypothetical protein DFH07DRAFT_775726 [Mycena maculata]|uniref:DUF6532 domain-containing protein n=1 Tax=Mycena maculata TaxID=230809 RepID=A0AAD7IT09_9AGAR|nr:hypothetical protein DFH07DRAFT_775726 [Mycena maculata]